MTDSNSAAMHGFGPVGGVCTVRIFGKQSSVATISGDITCAGPRSGIIHRTEHILGVINKATALAVSGEIAAQVMNRAIASNGWKPAP